MNEIKTYILSHWNECVKENRKDNETLLGLPYPYTVPAVGHFDELYYWDTYFTNKGLLLSDLHMLAKQNTDNMLYLVNQYGYMPNGNRTYYLGRSHPPFLSMMVRDIYEYYHDPVWLSSAYDTLKKEYEFWQKNRMSPCGLNVYGGAVNPAEIDSLAQYYASRIGHTPEGDPQDIARHLVIVCESGWDTNPRWGTKGYDFAPVDLNALLYAFEKNMEFFAQELDIDETSLWAQCAEERRILMTDLMEDENGLLLDYNFKTKTLSPILSAGSFFPLFTGLAQDRHTEALCQNLGRLEADFGILTCEKNDVPGIYQWNYPNGWACLQYMAWGGLARYGRTADAKRIAEKYILVVEKVFTDTGKLWEKYNVVDGNINVLDEYEMPAMMGWSAGAYLSALDFIENCQG